jgi:hypothetical protein
VLVISLKVVPFVLLPTTAALPHKVLHDQREVLYNDSDYVECGRNVRRLTLNLPTTTIVAQPFLMFC